MKTLKFLLSCNFFVNNKQKYFVMKSLNAKCYCLLSYFKEKNDKAMDQSDHVTKLHIYSFMKNNFFNLQSIFLKILET